MDYTGGAENAAYSSYSHPPSQPALDPGRRHEDPDDPRKRVANGEAVDDTGPEERRASCTAPFRDRVDARAPCHSGLEE